MLKNKKESCQTEMALQVLYEVETLIRLVTYKRFVFLIFCGLLDHPMKKVLIYSYVFTKFIFIVYLTQCGLGALNACLVAKQT